MSLCQNECMLRLTSNIEKCTIHPEPSTHTMCGCVCVPLLPEPVQYISLFTFGSNVIVVGADEAESWCVVTRKRCRINFNIYNTEKKLYKREEWIDCSSTELCRHKYCMVDLEILLDSSVRSASKSQHQLFMYMMMCLGFFFSSTFNNVWRKKSKLDGEEFIYLFIFSSFVATLAANAIPWLMLCFLLLLLFLWLLFFLRLIFLPSVVFCFHCGFVFLAHCFDKFRMTACNECRATTSTVVVRRDNQHLFRERKLFFSHSTEGTRARATHGWMTAINFEWMKRWKSTENTK